jgi:NAD(P)H-nitrite reductase large subunit
MEVWLRDIRPRLTEMVARHRDSEIALKAINSEIQLLRSTCVQRIITKIDETVILSCRKHKQADQSLRARESDEGILQEAEILEEVENGIRRYKFLL